jgi:hypothetical protein
MHRAIRCRLRLLATVACIGLAGCEFALVFDSGGFSETLEITRQPQSTTVRVGQSAEFFVGVAGGGRVTYQWRRNGLPIAGASGSVYVTPPATLADDGTLFTVSVCDEFDCLTSSPALLSVVRGQ